MTFVSKRIDLTINLGTGQFGESGANTVTLTGLRIRADVQEYGADAMPQCQLRVYGLTLSMMNQLTSIGPINSAVLYRNSAIIAAGDDGSALTTLYTGTIWKAWADLNQAPDAVLNIIAAGGLAASLKPVAASSYPGSADVGTIMQQLATLAGFSFVNHGVSVQLSTPYFYGTALAQIRECVRAADINFTIDNGALEIWPKNGARNLSSIPIISSQTGMVGYPAFSSNELVLTTLFNPSIKIGGVVQVESSLLVACGKWKVIQVAHSLESETPGGQWFSSIVATPYNVSA